MNTPRSPQFDELRTRRSTKVALVLLGTAGAITAATAIHAWRESRAEDDRATAPAAPPISRDQTYANNEYIPGVGYYHAPYHAWYAYPFNYHDPARGYFAGGLWQAAPFVLGMLRSQPSNEAVAAAMAAQRLREDEQRRQSGTSSSAARSGVGSRPFSSTPSASRPSSSPASRPAAPSSGSHITRGGFGSSGHSSGAS